MHPLKYILRLNHFKAAFIDDLFNDVSEKIRTIYELEPNQKHPFWNSKVLKLK